MPPCDRCPVSSTCGRFSRQVNSPGDWILCNDDGPAGADARDQWTGVPRSQRNNERPLPGRIATGPGRELTKELAWVVKIKPDHVKCSCKSLASEMDRDGVAKCLARRDEYYLPKLLANKTDIAKQLQSEGGLLSLAGTVAEFVPDAVALLWIKAKFNIACESARKSQGGL